MNHLITLAFFACCCHALQAQNLIAVEHNGQSTFYTTVPEAVQNAQSGATVYVPGGFFEINSPLLIDKPITIIGAGYLPDSTTATLPTVFIGDNIYLLNGSDNSLITGIHFYGGINFGQDNTTNYLIANCEIARCWFSGSYVQFNGAGSSIYKDIVIRENIIGNILFTTSETATIETSIRISNNIIQHLGYLYSSFARANVYNNIILSHPQNTFYSSFKNNIILGEPGNFGQSYFGGYSTLSNNLFESTAFNYDPSDILINNLNGLLPENNFVNFDDNFSIGNFHQYDLHLHPSSVGKNFGFDGTDVGIYGGLYPWKAGGVPYNPHIQTKTIAPTTNAQGSLNVQIRVAAQEH